MFLETSLHSVTPQLFHHFSLIRHKQLSHFRFNWSRSLFEMIPQTICQYCQRNHGLRGKFGDFYVWKLESVNKGTVNTYVTFVHFVRPGQRYLNFSYLTARFRRLWFQFGGFGTRAPPVRNPNRPYHKITFSSRHTHRACASFSRAWNAKLSPSP